MAIVFRRKLCAPVDPCRNDLGCISRFAHRQIRTTTSMKPVDYTLAEKIMGWTMHTHMLRTGPNGEYVADRIWWKDAQLRTAWNGGFEPSTNEQDALELLYRLNELGWRVDLSFRPEPVVGVLCKATY